MGLMKCEDCGKEHSDSAVACPNCGKPRAAAPVVTTQATGKYWKTMELCGVGSVLLGMISCAASDAGGGRMASVWLLVIGVGLWLSGRIGAWWEHG